MNPRLKARTVGASEIDWAGVVGEMTPAPSRREMARPLTQASGLLSLVADCRRDITG